jgi:hypothetical protein
MDVGMKKEVLEENDKRLVSYLLARKEKRKLSTSGCVPQRLTSTARTSSTGFAPISFSRPQEADNGVLIVEFHSLIKERYIQTFQ